MFLRRRFRSFAHLWLIASFLVVSPGPTLLWGQFAQEALAPQKPELVVQVYSLQYLSAEDAVEAVASLLNAERMLTIVADKKSNSVLARGTAETLEMIETLLQRLDIKPEPAKEASGNKLVIYDLRYVDVMSAQNVLDTVLHDSPGARISVDDRLNRIVIFASPEGHAAASKALNSIDVPRQDFTSIIDRSKLLGEEYGQVRMAINAAKKRQVNLEFIEESDIAVVKGSKASVTEFIAELEELNSKVEQHKAAVAVSANSSTHAIRITWLVPQDSPEAYQPPAGFESIVKRANQFGIKNPLDVAQLVATARTDGETPAEFRVSGTALINAEAKYAIHAEGSLAPIDQEKTAFNIRLVLSTSEVSEERSNQRTTTDVDVDMQVGAGKPVIFAAAPVNGTRSLFVVEIVAMQ